MAEMTFSEIGAEMTFREIGRAMNMTERQAQAIYSGAISKLRRGAHTTQLRRMLELALSKPIHERSDPAM